MFNNQRYITRGIDENVSCYLQNLMWHMISLVPEQDYLQVFELSEENGMQKIVHSQEEPEFEKLYYVKAEKPVNCKVFVIDDKTHSTMLMNYEYKKGDLKDERIKMCILR